MGEYPDGCGVVFGATGGIGRAIALSMAQLGSDLVLVYRSNSGIADQVRADVSGLGRRAEIVSCDIRDLDAVGRLFQQAREQFGRVHSVVDATGVTHAFSRVPEMEAAAFREVIETDVYGLFNIAKAAIPMMRESGGGSIVAIGTNATHRTLYGNAQSAVSKSANAMMVRHIAMEEGRKNIRANMVGAGIIDAGMAIDMRAGGKGQNSYEAFIQSVPLRRPGRAEELADLVAFLTSSRGTYINGQVIHVDGGLTA
jgi:NAD(P)-dependent dehydrogenase (short-subunit alcohol dehydrogenase family)